MIERKCNNWCFNKDVEAEVTAPGLSRKVLAFCDEAMVVENTFEGLTYLLARFFSRDNCFYCCVDAVCGKDLTVLATDMISVSVTEENCYTLSFKAEGGEGAC